MGKKDIKEMDSVAWARKLMAEEKEKAMHPDDREGGAVFRPNHYLQYFIEPFTFLMLNNVPFAEGNIIKYVMRWRAKNGIQDLKKARRIIDMLIEMEENKDDYIPKKRSL